MATLVLAGVLLPYYEPTNSDHSFFFQLRDAAPIGAGAFPAQSLRALEEERGRAIIRTKL